MVEIYMENALIRYLYKESDLFERLEIEYALENDEKLRYMFLQLKKAKQNLSNSLFLPSAGVIQNILNYSRQMSVEA